MVCTLRSACRSREQLSSNSANSMRMHPSHATPYALDSCGRGGFEGRLMRYPMRSVDLVILACDDEDDRGRDAVDVTSRRRPALVSVLAAAARSVIHHDASRHLTSRLSHPTPPHPHPRLQASPHHNTVGRLPPHLPPFPPHPRPHVVY